MKNYARIDAGRVAEIIQVITRDADAPAFIPVAIYGDRTIIGMTESQPIYGADPENPRNPVGVVIGHTEPEPIYGEREIIGMTQRPADWPTYSKGDEVPIEQCFTPEIVATLVQIPDGVTVKYGYTYDAATGFAPYVEPMPDAAAILARNTATRDGLQRVATDAIAPLQDAVDLEMATADEVTKLKAWKTYRVLLSRVDLAQWPAAWPAYPGV